MATEGNTAELVSIIIPTRDDNLIRQCIDSIQNKSTYDNYEIIVVDTGLKQKIKSNSNCKVFIYKEPFNYSRLNNYAVTEAAGSYLIFLNDDTSVISADWIEQMIKYGRRADVGAVGVKLLYPDNTVQHAGILIGVGGVTSHAFEGFKHDHPGHQGLLQSVRECSAVTAACAMIRKQVFQEIGGFDENLPFQYSDVDLCLKLRKKGYLIIYTPHAVLYHYTTTTRPYTFPIEYTKQFVRRWHDIILEGDPYYDPNLSRLRPDYSPRTREERFVLTDAGLFEESEIGISGTLKRYVKAAKTIKKQHGTKRLIIELARFVRIRWLEK